MKNLKKITLLFILISVNAKGSTDQSQSAVDQYRKRSQSIESSLRSSILATCERHFGYGNDCNFTLIREDRSRCKFKLFDNRSIGADRQQILDKVNNVINIHNRRCDREIQAYRRSSSTTPPLVVASKDEEKRVEKPDEKDIASSRSESKPRSVITPTKSPDETESTSDLNICEDVKVLAASIEDCEDFNNLNSEIKMIQRDLGKLKDKDKLQKLLSKFKKVDCKDNKTWSFGYCFKEYKSGGKSFNINKGTDFKNTKLQSYIDQSISCCKKYVNDNKTYIDRKLARISSLEKDIAQLTGSLDDISRDVVEVCKGCKVYQSSIYENVKDPTGLLKDINDRIFESLKTEDNTGTFVTSDDYNNLKENFCQMVTLGQMTAPKCIEFTTKLYSSYKGHSIYQTDEIPNGIKDKFDSKDAIKKCLSKSDVEYTDKQLQFIARKAELLHNLKFNEEESEDRKIRSYLFLNLEGNSKTTNCDSYKASIEYYRFYAPKESKEEYLIKIKDFDKKYREEFCPE